MSVKYRDYYEVLGVSRSATAEEIRKAYRTLARKYHPDANKGNRAFEEKFKEINEAYEVLKDPETRSRYDRLGANWKMGQDFTPPPEWEGFGGSRRGAPAGGGIGDFSDFFNMLFGQAAAGKAAGMRGGGPFFRMAGASPGVEVEFFNDADPGYGESEETQLEVPVETALFGGTMKVSLGGAGTRPRTYDIRIPKRISDGRTIRLAGEGGRGGDLLFKVRLVPSAGYRFEGLDVLVDLPVALWEAALGAKVSARTPDGTLAVSVPAGSSSGRRLRLRGQGLEGSRGVRGDLFLVVTIMLPPALTDADRAAISEMAARAGGWTPRG